MLRPLCSRYLYLCQQKCFSRGGGMCGEINLSIKQMRHLTWFGWSAWLSLTITFLGLKVETWRTLLESVGSILEFRCHLQQVRCTYFLWCCFCMAASDMWPCKISLRCLSTSPSIRAKAWLPTWPRSDSRLSSSESSVPKSREKKYTRFINIHT